MFSKKEFAIVSNLRFHAQIQDKFHAQAQLIWAWKKIYNLRAWYEKPDQLKVSKFPDQYQTLSKEAC